MTRQQAVESSILKDASVQIDGTTWHTWTDDDGELRFACPDGTDRIPVFDLDYPTRMLIERGLTKAYGDLFNTKEPS